jgi:hypothetical protein
MSNSAGKPTRHHRLTAQPLGFTSTLTGAGVAGNADAPGHPTPYASDLCRVVTAGPGPTAGAVDQPIVKGVA